MKRFKTIFPVLIAFFLGSCQEDSKNSVITARVSGNLNDVLIIMSEAKWDAEPGLAIKEALAEFVPALPQDEPSFDLVYVPHKGFGKTFKSQRNIIVTKIGANYREKKILIQPDLWAQTQMVMSIQAPSDTAFANLIKENRQKIVDIFNDAEMKRLVKGYRKSSNKVVAQKLAENHQLKINIPLGYKVTHDTEDFIRITNEFKDVTKGALVTQVLCVYHYPYTDTNTFSQEFLLEKRDQIMKKYVEGEVEGSYMTTETRAPIYFNELRLQNKLYAAELRGLWRMKEGMAMGGPFLNLSQYDEARKRIVTIEGFVFAPGVSKRNLMKQLEAIIYSVDYLSIQE